MVDAPVHPVMKEGNVELVAEPTGSGKGPGSRAPVFYNPGMIQNRDLSVVILQNLLDSGFFRDLRPVEILDGLTGSGIRAVRFAKEIDHPGRDLCITGVDLKEESFESAKLLAQRNGVDVDLQHMDLNRFLGNRRFDYIDIDPYGSPVHFLQTAILSLRKGGVLGVTATDTAALTGSVPRVARRRYGAMIGKTHFMQEMGCRTLLGYIARLAATFEISVKPLLFYSSDHFLRGYLSVDRGAKKADACLKDVGYFIMNPPSPPGIRSDIKGITEGSDLMGPVWTGPLSDVDICRSSLETLSRFPEGQIVRKRSIQRMLRTAISEDQLPPGGFDVNETASSYRTSPPSMRLITGRIEEEGYAWSRSRFSPTLLKTDVPFRVVEDVYLSGGAN